MQPNRLMLTALFVSTMLAGCANPPSDSKTPVADPTHEAAAQVATPPNLVPQPIGPVRIVPVDALYHDTIQGEGLGAWSGAANDPNRHYMTGIVNFTGSITGDATFVMKDAAAQPDHVYDGTKTWYFTGKIPGCGAGSLAFAGPGFGKMDGSRVRVNVTMRFVPGTASTGLAGVEDAVLYADGYDTYPRALKTTGKIWCRETPLPDRHGAVAIPVQAFYDDGGIGFGGGVDSTPYATGIVNWTGSLAGNAPWVAHLFPSTAGHLLDFDKKPVFTGSIPGCGSGTVSFYGTGFLRMDPQGVYTNLTLRPMPGSTSVGLAGLLDAVLYVDTYAWPQKAPVTGTLWCKRVQLPGHEGTRALPVKGLLDDSINGVGGGAWAGGYMTELVNMTGTMHGDAYFMMHNWETEASTSEPGRVGRFSKDVTFTGSIPSCGQGVVSFLGTGGWGKVDPPKGVYVNVTFRMVPGSASTGLSGLVDGIFHVGTYEYPQSRVPITGTLWCK